MASSRVVIVTGANSGVGFGASKTLASMAYEVILACRNATKAQQAIDDIKRENADAKVVFHECDLADLSSVEQFSKWFLDTGKPLFALLNNGGVVQGEGPRETTKDGFEMSIGVNHIGHFLLTCLLLPRLKESVQTYGEARIVHVSSGWHDHTADASYFTSVERHLLDFDDINLEKPGAYSWLQAYKNSKAAQLMIMKCLSRSLANTGVTSNACSPGLIPSTGIFRNLPWYRRLWLALVDNGLTRHRYNMKSLDVGIQQLVNAVHDEQLKDLSGIFYKNFTPGDAVSPEVADVSNQHRMWDLSCDMINRPEFKSILVKDASG